MTSIKRRDGLAFLSMREPKTTLPSTATLRPVPAWGRVKKALANDADAAFAAGAGLAALDAVVRAEPVFAGVWRQRLLNPAPGRHGTKGGG